MGDEYPTTKLPGNLPHAHSQPTILPTFPLPSVLVNSNPTAAANVAAISPINASSAGVLVTEVTPPIFSSVAAHSVAVSITVPPNVSLVAPGVSGITPSFQPTHSSVITQSQPLSHYANNHQYMTHHNNENENINFSQQNMQKGVIYALSQYSPFISISKTTPSQISSPISLENENSNLGPEDVDEVRQMTKAAAATSVQEHIPKRVSGKCHNGGELRLSELEETLNTYAIPEGFCLVGAKSPMLAGMILVVVVDKRYLPGDPNTITMLGFSGNCIGCGATGFRYFTEFSTHINLKLATQPKKQKHLKYYITQNSDGRWGRGLLIPWKETRKRSVPAYSMPLFGRTPEVIPSFTRTLTKSKSQLPILVSSVNECGEPELKKVKSDVDDTDQSVSVIIDFESQQTQQDFSQPPTTTESDILYSSFKKPMSNICGVRPVLLLCHGNSCKLPPSVNDIIISDLLADCFDLPDTSSIPRAKTPSTYHYTATSIMSTGAEALPVSETLPKNVSLSPQSISMVEKNAANMLINMSGNMNDVTIPVTTDTKDWTKTSNQASIKKERIAKLPLQAAIILMTQYLCALDDTSISKEQIEYILNKSKIELNASKSTNFTVSQYIIGNSAQVAFTLNLLCSASDGKVKAITSSHSLQNGIYKALQWIHDTFYMSSVSNKKLRLPDFVVILCTPHTGPMELAILVTGVSHAKILAECLGISSIMQSPFQDDLQRLIKQFQQTTDALDSLIKMIEEARDNMVYIPFNAYPGMRISPSQAEEYTPDVAPISAQPTHTKGIFSNQVAMAHQLLSQLRNIGENPEIIDLASFHKVELMIVVPPTISLYYLTVKRLCQSGLLNYLGLESENSLTNHSLGEKYVITYSDWPESVNRWNSFVKSAQEDKETLFLIIFDQAQRYSLPQGMPDVLPNLKEVFESTNVIPVFVTSVPYIFQTRKSFIDPDNEVYWTDARYQPASSKYGDDKHVIINDSDMIYFGIKDFCESTRWNQQFALIRHEETFDVTVPKANSLNDINYSMVQGFVLLRLYKAALMVAGGIKPAEPYAVMSVIRMVNDVVEAPLRNADGSGCMLMIRIPNKQLGRYFHDTLLKTRNSLGFQHRFDVIYDDGDSELMIGDYFLERMRLWRVKTGWNVEETKLWRPRCLEELLDLPSLLILSGENRAGETFPRSLKYIDFNIINHSSFHRSTIEAEIGSISCYMSVNAGTHSALSNKPVVMNNMRSIVGTTYMSSAKIRKAEKLCRAVRCDKKSHGNEKCDACLSKDHVKIHVDSTTHFTSKYPLPILLVSKPLWKLLQAESGSTPGIVHLNSDPHTRWVMSDRPLMTSLKPDHMSRHYRRWTDARPERKVLSSCSNPQSPSSGDIEETGTTEGDFSRLLTFGRKARSDSDKHYVAEQLDHDDKDNDYNNKNQYHPRCLLLSGPPQAGKTGAYLHFARLLHRMLMRLKRVDVFDNCITYIPSSIKMSYSYFPTGKTVLNTKFFEGYLDSTFQKMSPVCIYTDNVKLEQLKSCELEEGSESALVILSKTSCFDTYHHCDICKFYREGIGHNATKVYTYSLNMNDGTSVQLPFSIPPIHLKYFVIHETERTMSSVTLATFDREQMVTTQFPMRSAKTPIFMFSSSGEEEGLFNLFHAMEETDHIHITFIRNGELKKYQKHWPNHVFVELPISFNNVSDSAIRNLVKCFASQNYKSEIERQSCGEEGNFDQVWPFVLIIPDNLVMWQTCGKEENSESDSSDDEDRSIQKKHPSITESVMSPCNTRRDTSSLLEFLLTLENESDSLDFGLIGIRPWSSYQEENGMPSFLRTFVTSCLFLNIALVGELTFSSHLFNGDEIDFQLQMIKNQIPFCRLENFSFMTKITTRVSWREAEYLKDSKTLLSDLNDVDTLVVQPDVENENLIDASADLMMQKYVSISGSILFPSGMCNTDSPVLIVGSYMDLGSDIKVSVINDCNKALESSQLDVTYSGLIIYNNSKELNAEWLSQFKFAYKSSLLLICNERYDLRSELNRLDLEENWRFRFRDEYKTAIVSHDDNRTLYFLIGSYVAG